MSIKPKLWHLILGTILLFGFTFKGVGAGWFKGMYWIDIPLHLLGGVLLGFVFWWILDLPVNKDKSTNFIWLAFLGFVSIGNYLWEVYEYATWKYFYDVAEPWKLYSPTVSDLLSDMILASAGSLLVFVLYYYEKRRRALKEKN